MCANAYPRSDFMLICQQYTRLVPWIGKETNDQMCFLNMEYIRGNYNNRGTKFPDVHVNTLFGFVLFTHVIFIDEWEVTIGIPAHVQCSEFTFLVVHSTNDNRLSVF